MKVPIEISARHIHLSQKDLEFLFGPNYPLTKLKKLSQPGQFAAKETINIIGPKNSIEKVRIVGPIREQTQIELSKTDAYTLGIKPLTRVSGDLDDTTGSVTITGLKGQIDLHNGVIIAQRHLHIEIGKAKELGLIHGQIISIKTTNARSITFHDVIVRSRQNKDILAFHLDIDEANAADVKNGDEGELVM